PNALFKNGFGLHLTAMVQRFLLVFCCLFRRATDVIRSTIVRPNREAPFPCAYKVCMVVRDAKVVNRAILAFVRNGFQFAPHTIVAAKEVADLQIASPRPATSVHEESVRTSYADEPTANL